MANCTVIGLGKLGACLAAVLSDAGHTVCGVDLNPVVVDQIKRGVAPVHEPGLQMLMDAAPFQAFTDYPSALIGSDIAFVVVPTPSLPDGGFDDTLVRDAVAKVAAEIYHTGPTVVVVCSTVMPGTCNAIAETLPSEISLVYSPEFIAIGSVIDDMRNPDLVLIGTGDDGSITRDSRDEYGEFITMSVLEKTWRNQPHVALLSRTEAELAKIAVNSYVTMKISFANELAAICEAHEGVSARTITAAIGHDSRIGGKYLNPGTAFGGPCFPRDSKAYRAAARMAGVRGLLAIATDGVNTTVIERSYARAQEHPGPVAILGTSYKPGTHVIEQSAGVRLARRLLDTGRTVYTYDPGNNAVISTDYGATTIPLDDMDDANLCACVFVMTPWSLFEQFDARVPTQDCWGIVPLNDNVSVVGEGP